MAENQRNSPSQCADTVLHMQICETSSSFWSYGDETYCWHKRLVTRYNVLIPINKIIFYFVSFIVSFTAIAIPFYLVGDARNSLYLTLIILLDIKFLFYLYIAAIKKLNILDKNLFIFILILILGLFMNLINEGNILSYLNY